MSDACCWCGCREAPPTGDAGEWRDPTWSFARAGVVEQRACPTCVRVHLVEIEG
ncbi:MAG: hypothetical protein WEA35_08020 [Candidatus Nanopelagicales bacterium]